MLFIDYSSAFNTKVPSKLINKLTLQTIPPQETEKIWHGSSDPQKVLQLHHREHPDWLHHCKALQRVVRTSQYITGAKLPAIRDLYTRRCQRKALKIAKDPSHSSHRLFSLLSATDCSLCYPSPSLHHCYSLLLSMRSHFNNSTYMCILPQLTGTPAH